MELILQDINKENALKIIEELSEEKQEEETILIINSFGGSVFWGLKIYEAIQNAKYQTTGIVIYEASSIAILILEACAKRYIEKNSRIIFHSAELCSKPLHEVTTEFLLKAHAQEKSVIQKIYERTQISCERIKEFMRNDQKFTAEEARDWGLVDKICEA